MLNAMIIDDDNSCRKFISEFIEKNFSNIQIVAETDSPKQSMELIRQNEVDILFLDINLGKTKEAGFNLLNKDDSPSFDLILTSETETQALTAFDYAASDYLVKPICPDRLKRCVYKLMHKKNENRKQGNSMEHLKEAGMLERKIGLCDKYELNFVKLSDIYYCEAEGFYTLFHLKNGKTILVSKNIKEYELALPEKFFFRTHKSFLINLKEISKYVKSDGGYIVMENGDVVPLSVRKKEDFLRSVMYFSI